MYKTVAGLFPPATSLGPNPGPAESLVLGYLQDFHDTVGDNFLMLGKSDAEIISHGLRNQLAIFRTFWRFENYIKQIARLSTEGIGAALKGR